MGCPEWRSLSCPGEVLVPLGRVGALRSPVHSFTVASSWQLWSDSGFPLSRTWSHACPAWRASSAPPAQVRGARHPPTMALCTAVHSSRGPCSSPSAPPPTSRVSWTSEWGVGGAGPGVGQPAAEGGASGMMPGPPTALLPSCPSHWLKLPPLLSSSSVTLRILAGEAIALIFELAQDVEVWWGAAAAEGSQWAGSRAAGNCWHRHPAHAPAELALMALGCTRLASPAGAQAEGLAPVVPPAVSWRWQWWTVPGAASPPTSPVFLAGGLVPPRYRVPASPAQGFGYREQQVPSQDRPTEAALHLPGHPALH